MFRKVVHKSVTIIVIEIDNSINKIFFSFCSLYLGVGSGTERFVLPLLHQYFQSSYSLAQSSW